MLQTWWMHNFITYSYFNYAKITFSYITSTLFVRTAADDVTDIQYIHVGKLSAYRSTMVQKKPLTVEKGPQCFSVSPYVWEDSAYLCLVFQGACLRARCTRTVRHGARGTVSCASVSTAASTVKQRCVSGPVTVPDMCPDAVVPSVKVRAHFVLRSLAALICVWDKLSIMMLPCVAWC